MIWAMRSVRVATWNLDSWGRNKQKVPRWKFLSEIGPKFVELQEVRGDEIERFRGNLDGPSYFSQEIFERANLRWIGCGILLPNGAEVRNVGLVETLPKPQRSLWV